MPIDERLDRASLAADDLPDDELVAAGAQVAEELEVLRRIDARFKGAILRRMSEDQTQIITDEWTATETARTTYEWDIEALIAKVRPVLGEARWHSFVTETPPAPPTPTYKVNTRGLLALAKRLGQRGAVIHECYTRFETSQGVSYERNQ